MYRNGRPTTTHCPQVLPERLYIERCERCGGKVRIIASIEDPQVIGRILAYLEPTKPASGSAADLTTAHRARGPPGQREFDLN